MLSFYAHTNEEINRLHAISPPRRNSRQLYGNKPANYLSRLVRQAATAAPIPNLSATSMSSSLSTTAAAADGGEDNLPFRYRWPRPSVTVDCLIYALDEGAPWILLIKRKNEPFKGGWALPGKPYRALLL